MGGKEGKARSDSDPDGKGMEVEEEGRHGCGGCGVGRWGCVRVETAETRRPRVGWEGWGSRWSMRA